MRAVPTLSALKPSLSICQLALPLSMNQIRPREYLLIQTSVHPNGLSRCRSDDRDVVELLNVNFDQQNPVEDRLPLASTMAIRALIAGEA